MHTHARNIKKTLFISLMTRNNNESNKQLHLSFIRLTLCMLEKKYSNTSQGVDSLAQWLEHWMYIYKLCVLCQGRNSLNSQWLNSVIYSATNHWAEALDAIWRRSDDTLLMSVPRSWFDLLYSWPPNSDLLLNKSLLKLIYFFSRRHFKIFFFLIFPQNRLWHFMQFVSLGGKLHEMSKQIFRGK